MNGLRAATAGEIQQIYMERLGYRGFLSAVWLLWKMNRNARKLGLKTKAEFIVGMPWLR